MSLRRSKMRWSTGLAAILVLGIAGFLIGRHGAVGGAEARQDRLQYRAAGGEFEGIVPVSSPYAVAELVGPRKGWALTDSRLAWTTDGGDSWSTITPPGIKARSIHAARFDRSGDGVVVACREGQGNAIPVPLAFFRTADNGRTWKVSTLRGERPGSIGSVRATERDGNWWVLVDEAGVDLAGTRLYESRDAGKSWQVRPRPPAAGRFTFLSQDEGWIVGGEGSQLIFRTDDAGGSWEVPEVPFPGPIEPGETVPTVHGGKVPPRSEMAPTGPREIPLPEEEVVPVPGEGSNRRIVEYGLPERGPGGVLLPVAITTPAGRTEVLLYERSGRGAWEKLSATKLARTTENIELTGTFVAPGELLIQNRGANDGPPALIKVSTRSGGSGSSQRGARTTRIGRALGLPEALPLHFVDRLHGVAEGARLFLTTDGGRDWSPVSAPP